MTFLNVVSHYKSILALFLVCTAINLPILIFIDPISKWFTTFSNIDDATETVISNNYVLFILLSFINLPLFIKLVNNRSYLYEILYGVLTILICILNPAEIFTTTYDLPYLLIGIIFTFFCIKNLPTIITEVLLIISTIILNLLSESAIHTLWGDPSWFILLFILIYIGGYSFVLSTTSMAARLDVIRSNSERIIGRASTVSTILIIEVLFIILMLYARSVSKQYYGGNLIVHEPISLSKISTFKTNQVYNYEYTISCWMYMNATSSGYSQSSSEYTDVLLFGQELLMAYNSSLNKLKIIMKGKNKKNVYDVKHLPLQKWNHFVISYVNGKFDLFMNGELIKTSSIIPYSETHELMVGFENGVSGKLCNLMYFNNVISIEKINNLYTQFSSKNPPTF
jgi:hypothetical protein